MSKKVLHVMYNDEEHLMHAAKEIIAKGVRVKDVFSPFPIHGLDPIIGVKRTRLAITSFMYAMMGTCLAIGGMYYFMIHDWQMNIGGKPSYELWQNIPAFIPITFEFTVLCAAHGMSLTYLLRNGTLPGMPATNPDPRTTDDKFVMELTTEQNGQFSTDDLENMVRETEMIELSVKEYDND